MKLPNVSTTLALLAILWGAAGVAAHGMAILAYPLAWLGLCLFFVTMNLGYDLVSVRNSAESTGRWPLFLSRSNEAVAAEEQASAA
ncbi:MAG: hypothetical protein KDA42_01170 [Planctomycetales bacterium]|nr:hypothetical protein [Planctomycetales bacterium]